LSQGHEIVYGRRPVAEAEAGRRRVLRVHRSPDTPERELERLAGSPDHQGVVAEVEPFPYADGNALLERKEGLILALDQVQDPRNLGAACRSAEVAGVTGVVITERRSAAITPAACKASAGAVEHLEVARVTNLANWLGDARESGYWIWGAAGEEGSPPWQVDLTGPTVLVLGSEGRGLRPRVRSFCDGIVSIPQYGRTGSLNVSAAATAILFEAVRQRAAG
jgi:23S rRNA (guanosine2251-2'-O)-methyltransferase